MYKESIVATYGHLEINDKKQRLDNPIHELRLGSTRRMREKFNRKQTVTSSRDMVA